jgi:hypothetical protein
MLMSVDLDSGIALAREESAAGSKMISLRPGSKIGAFSVAGAQEVTLSGLQAAYDPFFPVVLLALAVIVLGAFITFARKLGDLKP